MTGTELRSAAIEIWGERGWTSSLAVALKVDRVTVYRWLQGVNVPGPVEAAVECWLRRFRETGEKPCAAMPQRP